MGRKIVGGKRLLLATKSNFEKRPLAAKYHVIKVNFGHKNHPHRKKITKFRKLKFLLFFLICYIFVKKMKKKFIFYVIYS